MKARSQSILFVSSNQDLTTQLYDMFSSMNIRMYNSIRITEAISKSNNQKFNMILAESLVNNQSIHKHIDHFRNLTSLNKETPIVLCCENMAEQIPEKSLPFINAYLVKPFSAEHVCSALKTYSVI